MVVQQDFQQRTGIQGRLFRWLSWCLPVLLLIGANPAQAEETIRHASGLRHLTPEQAEEGLPVELVATITYVDPGRNVFIQDETGGTFFLGPETKKPFHQGDLVRVSGKSYPGLYVPGIQAKSAQLLGKGKLPVPRKVSYDELAAGRFNYEYVQVEGIGRAMLPVPEDRCTLLLATGSRKLEIQIPEPIDEVFNRYIDARVQVTGLAAGFINGKRQLVAPHIRVQGTEQLKILEPAPTDPFDVTLYSMAELLRFNPEGISGHRVKVQGVVTAFQTGTALYLRDEERGLVVQTPDARRLEAGDVVEVAGFPVMGNFSAMLEDAVFRRVARTNPPVPVECTVRDILKGSFDANLVTLQASVLEFLAGKSETTLVLQSSNDVFRARLERTSGDLAMNLQPGTQIEVTGVCLVDLVTSSSPSFSTRPRSFELLLRSPSDVRVLVQPPWWTPEHLALALVLILVLALLALLWALQLRVRVQKQTTIIRDSVEREAALEERQRIAREFHDTLEQELVGVSLRLDAATTRVAEPKARDLIEATRRLVGRLQVEAREFVWNLRGSKVDPASLLQVLERSAKDLRASSGIDIQLSTEGELADVPQGLAHPLLRIAQEAMTNAVKHSQAKKVEVKIEIGAERLRLEVKDDGKGFDPSQAQSSRPGHFGLQGMEERAKKTGGQFRLDSRAGQGTCIVFEAPLR